MTKITSEQLASALNSPDWLVRYLAIEQYSKQKPHIEDLPLLRQALRDSYFGTVRCAAHSIRKLGQTAQDAVEDLISAAEVIDTATGLPQSFPDAIVALAYVAPHEQRILNLIRANIHHDNWNPIKSSIEALKRVGSPQSNELIREIVQRWTSEANKTQNKYFDSVLLELSSNE